MIYHAQTNWATKSFGNSVAEFEYLRLSCQGSSRSWHQAGMFDREGVTSVKREVQAQLVTCSTPDCQTLTDLNLVNAIIYKLQPGLHQRERHHRDRKRDRRNTGMPARGEWWRSWLYRSMRGKTTTWFTGRRPQHWTMAEDRSCWWRRPCTSRWYPQRSTSIPRWRTWSPYLLDRCDEEAGWEGQSSPTFDLQWCVSSVVHGYK